MTHYARPGEHPNDPPNLLEIIQSLRVLPGTGRAPVRQRRSANYPRQYMPVPKDAQGSC